MKSPTRRMMKSGSLLGAGLLLLGACAGQPTSEKPTTVEEAMPLTMANIRGHQALYNEGWFFISSSKNAMEYAKRKSVDDSSRAIGRAIDHMAKHGRSFGESLSDDVKGGAVTGAKVFAGGTAISADILRWSRDQTTRQVNYSRRTFARAGETFVHGYMYLGKRTADERGALMKLPGDYFANLNSDFSNIYDISEKMRTDFGRDIQRAWGPAWSSAKKRFQRAYHRSGRADNSISALGKLFRGYGESLYVGLVRPTAATTVTTAKGAASAAGQAVFLPTATVFSVTGRTVQTVGLTVYRTAELGVELISPTVEAGLLSGLALASAGTAPITFVAGSSVGVVNQVAVTTVAPVAGAGKAAVDVSVDTVTHTAMLTYDAVKGTTEVVINQASAGIVLGYNALTALPAHLLMGVVDGAVLLVMDGPNLVVAYVRGDIGSGEDQVGMGEMPVGTIMNVDELRARGVEVEVLSDDPAVIEEVMKKLPEDLHD